MNDWLNKLYEKFRENPLISTDSRKIPNGSIFFALKGETFDGNRFAEDALKKGARFAVVSDESLKEKEDQGFLWVDDTIEALQKLARHHRNQFDIPVIGITGTNGKTTSKELCGTVLKKKYNTLITQGNFNNHIGLPLTILKLTAQHEIAVIEMGANHIGEIEELCNIANPTHGLITNIGKAHLEGFGSIEGIIQTKSALYKHVQKHNGRVFVNSSNTLLKEISRGHNRLLFGSDKKAEIHGELKKALPYLEIFFEGKENHLIKTKLAGAYNFENVMSALAMGIEFGLDEETIINALQQYEPVNKRSQVVRTGYNTVILDAYNANPSSMEQALDSFFAQEYHEKMLILGDMLELGDQSLQEHQAIVERIASEFSGITILVGKEFEKVQKKNSFLHFPDSQSARQYLEKNKPEEYWILVKGSRGIQMEEVMNAL